MKRLFILAVLLSSFAFGQTLVRYTQPFPSISSQSPPFLVANTSPPPILTVCQSPATSPQCSYATTMTGQGIACPSGAQDTPDPNALTSACQPTGDSQGNIGFWIYSGTYDYFVTIGTTVLGPYTVTLGNGTGAVLPGTAECSAYYASTGSILSPECALNWSGSNPTFSGLGTFDLGLNVPGGSFNLGTVPTINPCGNATGCDATTSASSGAVVPTALWVTHRWLAGTQVCSVNGGTESAGACGTGGSSTPGGNVGTAQSHSAAGALAGENILYTDQFNWNQTVTTNLATVGSNTITLTPCPLGINTANSATEPYYVYIPTTNAEAALVTGGTCTSGLSTGTIIVTTTVAHSASSNTVQSAYWGIQEALNVAGSPNTLVWIPPSGITANAYQIYATIYQQANRSTVMGYGALLACHTRSVCWFIGDRTSANDFGDQRIKGVRFTGTLGIDGVQVTSVATASNVVTMTAASHPFIVGDYVAFNVAVPTYSSFHGIWGPITATTTNTFSFAATRNNVSATAAFGTVALEMAAIEDNSNASLLEDIDMSSAGNNIGPCNINPTTCQVFNNDIIIDNDQATLIHHFDTEGGSQIRTTANWIGWGVWARGDQANSAVVTIDGGSNISMDCANGVYNASGNFTTVRDTVIQAYAQYGINQLSGLQGGLYDGVYEEQDCGNPLYTAVVEIDGTAVGTFQAGETATQAVSGATGTIVNPIPSGAGYMHLVNPTGVADATHTWTGGTSGATLTGPSLPVPGLFSAAGLSNQGQSATVRGGTQLVGTTPTFPFAGTAGSTTLLYYVVAHLNSNYSIPLFVGYAQSTGATGTIYVFWPQLPQDNAIVDTALATYDLLVVTNSTSATAPVGTANYAVATAITTSNCSNGICSYSDTQGSRSSYTVGTAPFYVPKLDNWPGHIVLSAGQDAVSGILSIAPYFGDQVTVNSASVVVAASAYPALFLHQAYSGQYPTVVMQASFPSGSNQALTIPNGNPFPQGAATFTGTPQGSLIFTGNANAPYHVITLKDSQRQTTLAGGGKRVTASASDSFIGQDLSGTSFGDAAGISFYIGNTGDNLSYLERLTASTKTFAPAITLIANGPVQLNQQCTGIGCGPFSLSGNQAIDLFNRANCTSSCGSGQGLGSNWYVMDGTWTIVSNAANYVIGGDSYAFAAYTATTFGNDQYSNVTLNTLSGGYAGAAVRLTGSATESGYYCESSTSNAYLDKTVSGTTTLLATLGSGFPAGTILSLQVIGTALTCFANGKSILTATDSSLTSGYPGIMAVNAPVATMENFSGGTLAYSSSAQLTIGGAFNVSTVTASGAVTVNGARWTSGSGAPSGNCGVGSIYTNTSASTTSTVFYVCEPINSWNAVTVP
jgi:hypothetical protein